MMSHLGNNWLNVGPNDEHAYSVGGNFLTEFLIGNPSDPNDFFILGTRPASESPLMPCITARILHADGTVALSIVRNRLDGDMYSLQWVHGDDPALGQGVGFKVVDHAGETVFSVKTAWTKTDSFELNLTTIHGTFYDKNGDVLVQGSEDGLEIRCRAWLSGIVLGGYSDIEIQLVSAMIGSGGRINRLLTGTIEDKEFVLDGAFIVDLTLNRCIVHVHAGEFMASGMNRFDATTFQFGPGPAGQVYELLKRIEGTPPTE